jgi:hypothetical protein
MVEWGKAKAGRLLGQRVAARPVTGRGSDTLGRDTLPASRLLYETPKGRGIGQAAHLPRGAIELGQSEGPGASFIWKVGAMWRPGPINAGWLHMVKAASFPLWGHCRGRTSVEA